MAYRNGQQIWDTSLATPECSYVGAQNIVIGHDGNVYVLAGYNCTYSGSKDMVGIDSSDGHIAVRTNVSGSSGQIINGLQAYNDGLIVYLDNPSRFRFFDYNGNEDTTDSFDASITNDEYINETWRATPSGDIYYYVAYLTSSPPVSGCSLVQPAKKVIRHNLDGHESTYDLSSLCMTSSDIEVMPNGGAVLDIYNNDSTPPGILMLNTDTTTPTVISVSSPFSTHYTNMDSQHGLKVDLGGNIIFSRYYGYSHDGQNDTDFDITMFSSDGEQLSRFSSEDWNTNSNDYFVVNQDQLDIAPGVVYVVVYDNYYGIGKLYSVPFKGVDYDYQRGVMLGVPPQPMVAQLNYVALGDSFSSGEGVEPFMPPSDSNGCHRSWLSYPKLLDEDTTLNITLDAFLACSGATINDVESTANNDGQPTGQISLLGSYEDIVSLSVGGNDIGFSVVADACATGSEQDCADAIQTAGSKINDDLQDRLTQLYTAIGGKIGQNTQVYVLGYPQIFPEREQVTSECTWGDGSLGQTTGRDVTDTELSALRGLTTDLDLRIENAVASMGAKFHYVDTISALAQHPLCTSQPWFNGVVVHLTNYVYSYHPNQYGQLAMEQALSSAIQLNS